MRELIKIKESMREIYGKYSAFIDPMLKFILSMVTYGLINAAIGNMSILKNPLIMVLFALINALLPANAIIVFASAFSVLHIYSESVFAAAIVFAAFMLMYLLYFRFSPNDAIIVLLTPISFALHIPYAIPVCAGIGGNIFSCISVAAGVFSWYLVNYCSTVKIDFAESDVESLATSLRSFIEGLVVNKTMLLVLISFVVTTIVVSLVKRFRFNHSRDIAVVGGAVLNMLIIMIGRGVMRLNISILNLFIGTVVAVPIALLLNFFIFAVDYAKTENLEFEDDEYYYYVKAVPKLTSDRFNDD